MKKYILMVLCLLFAQNAWAANDFSGSNACALWKFENDLTDDINSNNLTDYNTVQFDGDPADHQEGAYASYYDIANSEAGYIADGDLSTDFPGKSGTSEQDFTICCWAKFGSVPTSGGYTAIIDKLGTSTRSWNVGVVDDSGTSRIYFGIGYSSGTQSTRLDFGTGATTGVWYHIGAVYTASDNSMRLRVWDDNAGALLGSNATGTAGGDMSPDTEYIRVGKSAAGGLYYDGWIDELVIFKGEALSDADIDAIRDGTYGAGATTSAIHILYQ